MVISESPFYNTIINIDPVDYSLHFYPLSRIQIPLGFLPISKVGSSQSFTGSSSLLGPLETGDS